MKLDLPYQSWLILLIRSKHILGSFRKRLKFLDVPIFLDLNGSPAIVKHQNS